MIKEIIIIFIEKKDLWLLFFIRNIGRRITDKIIICLDGDSAGIRAARRLSDIALPLINVKKNIAMAILPNELDPDDFIKTYGAQAFTKFLDEAKSLSQSLFDFAISDLKLKNKTL